MTQVLYHILKVSIFYNYTYITCYYEAFIFNCVHLFIIYLLVLDFVYARAIQFYFV